MPDYGSLKRGLAHYWTMDNGSYPYWQWDKMRTSHLTTWGVQPPGGIRVASKLGHGCNLSVAPVGASDHSYPIFPVAPDALTFSIWFRMDAAETSPYVFISPAVSPPGGGYYLKYIAAGSFRFVVTNPHALPLLGPTTTVEAAYAAENGEWIHALVFWDIAAQQIGLRINNGIVAWTHSTDIQAYAPGYALELGPQFSGVIDDTAIWTRILKDHEQDWLWNDGDGLDFDHFASYEDEEACQAIPCCDEDPFTYQASTATPSGAATGSACADLPVVTIDPSESSLISFPTFIILTESISGAVIRYTTDGTDPTEESAIYSIPFQIFGPSTTVKAKAWLGECGGPVTAATYRRTVFDLTFKNICPPSPQRAGVWGDFVGGTQANYQWELDLTLSDPLHIVALDIYQTNVAGVWNTGQAWSTREYIDPPGAKPHFHVFPLVLDESGQLNNAYADDFSATFGDFAAGAHGINCFGAVQKVIYGVSYYRMRGFLEDGTVLERIIASDTCDPPPCETYPPDPTVTPSCTDITVAFTTAAGNPYQVWRWSSAGGGLILVSSGTTTAGPDSFVDASVEQNVGYCYHLRVKYGLCPEYTASNAVCVVLLPLAKLTVVPDTTLIESDAGIVTFTITSENVDPLGACGSNEVEYTYTDGTGAHAGSVLANMLRTLAVAVTRPAAAPYVASFDFTACNNCNTAAVHVDILFVAPPSCPGTSPPLPASIAVDLASILAALPGVLTCTDFFSSCYAVGVSDEVPTWHGELAYQSACLYYSPGSMKLTAYECADHSVRSLGYVSATVNFAGSPGQWSLSVHIASGEFDIALWGGVKPQGDTPVGLYTRTLGCLTMGTLRIT